MFYRDPDFEAFLFGGSDFSSELLSLLVACVIEVEGLLKSAVILDISSNKSWKPHKDENHQINSVLTHEERKRAAKLSIGYT